MYVREYNRFSMQKRENMQIWNCYFVIFLLNRNIYCTSVEVWSQVRLVDFILVSPQNTNPFLNRCVDIVQVALIVKRNNDNYYNNKRVPDS